MTKVHLVNTQSENENAKENTKNGHAMQIANFHSNSDTEVLLKTAIAPVWYENCRSEANILFDEGAQKSFITEELEVFMNLPTTSTENIQLTAFGSMKEK